MTFLDQLLLPYNFLWHGHVKNVGLLFHFCQFYEPLNDDMVLSYDKMVPVEYEKQTKQNKTKQNKKQNKTKTKQNKSKQNKNSHL